MAEFSSIRFQSGRPLLKELGAERMNAIVAEIKRNRPKGERGITVRQSGDGTYIGLASGVSRGGSSASIGPQPWDLVARQDPNNEGQYIVTVRPGTLNGFLPTNWNEEFVADNTSLYYAKAIVSTDGREMTGLTIAADTAPPAPQSAQEFGIDGQIELVFGLFLAGLPYRTIGASFVASPKLWLTTEKQTPPAAGELPFAQYFYFR